GNVIQVTDAVGNVTSATYDANGNRLSESKSRTTPTGVEVLVTTFQYDARNRLVTTIQPDGSTTRTIYDAIGQRTAVVDPSGRQTTSEYDPAGHVFRTPYPDGTQETSAYDAGGRRIASRDRGGRVTTYEYDAIGRLITTTYADGATMTSTYDAAGRLTAQTDSL